MVHPCACWQEALVPCYLGLFIRPTTWQLALPRATDPKMKNDQDGNVSDNLISEATYPVFYHIMLGSQTNSFEMWERSHMKARIPGSKDPRGGWRLAVMMRLLDCGALAGNQVLFQFNLLEFSQVVFTMHENSQARPRKYLCCNCLPYTYL